MYNDRLIFKTSSLDEVYYLKDSIFVKFNSKRNTISNSTLNGGINNNLKYLFNHHLSQETINYLENHDLNEYLIKHCDCLKFDSKQSLFGRTAAKEWVLLANYYDKSNIRNYLAYNLANKLDFGFQPSSIFVDVYFNNEYIGLYTLTEQLEANEGRVDIKNNTNKGISSFLLEADDRALDEYKGYAGRCYVDSGNYHFALKYPDADDYVDAVNENDISVIKEFQMNTDWLKKYLDEVSDAIATSDYSVYSKYIDVDSFVDYYIVQELYKNLDVASTSQYYVIDQSAD